LLDTAFHLDFDNDQRDGDVSGISTKQRSGRIVLHRTSHGAGADFLANAFYFQHAAIGNTVEHRQLTDVLHHERLDSDDQLDTLLGANRGLAEYDHQRDHRRLWLSHELRVERRLPHPGARS